MDAQAKKKALFRAKLNAKKQENQRIDSPLVRYNEHDQPVCRVCDVIIKSESLWPAHQASRKHHEAIDKLKASAAAVNRPNNAKPESTKELPKRKLESLGELNDKSEPSTALHSTRSSTLPHDFFDNHDNKRQKSERDSSKFGDSHKKDSAPAKAQVLKAFGTGSGIDGTPSANSFQKTDSSFHASKDFQQMPQTASTIEAKQVKGALPEGFFDDKDSDLRARGITLVKPDVKDEYKEFEKLIQPDLQEIDNRLEEEEFDAAEMIEEEETIEQRSYIERVEMLRRKKLELRASRSAVASKDTAVTHKEPSREDSSSDDEDNENFKFDWRAKHL